MDERWLTYVQAAEVLGMTPDAVRQRARRLGWRRQTSNTGRTLVLVPGDTERSSVEHRAVNHRGRIADLEARAAELRADFERERRGGVEGQGDRVHG